jgi:hypothetical protein
MFAFLVAGSTSRLDSAPWSTAASMRWLLIMLCSLVLATTALAQTTQPPLNVNEWNFVLVQSFEAASGKSNNLSTEGLNHALRFGQLLDSQLAGKFGQLRQVYAFEYAADGNDMSALESIEPFAVLNNLGVTVQKLSAGDASVYNSPGYFIQQVLANRPRGTYVMAMPARMLQSVASALTDTSVDALRAHQYLVVSGHEGAFKATVYDDGISDIADYPHVSLPPASACTQKPVTIHVNAPAGLHAYASQSIFLVRHVEAHPNETFEDGNYVCQGQWRALGANAILLQKMHGRVLDFVFTSDPSNIIGCDATCSYIRPSLTVAPFAILHGLPLTLAPFQWEDATDLAQALFDQNSRYFKHPASGSSILVGWEHANIEKAVKYLLKTLYENPTAASEVPAWDYRDYDSIWEIDTDKDGNLTFKNTCEGIASTALPSTCPAFPQ